MEEAIKILEKAIEVAQQRLAYIKNASTRIEHSVVIHDEYTTYSDSAIQDAERITQELVGEYQAAIEVLQRKAKKDPRVDGLPEYTSLSKVAGIDLFLHESPLLLVWGKRHDKFPVIGKFVKELGWYVNSIDSGYLPTDDILFYCNPDDIV